MLRLEKENRKQAGIPDPVIESKTPQKTNTPETQPKKAVETKTSSTPESFQNKYPEYADELYKIAKKAVEENIEDFASFAPATKASIAMLKRKQALANKKGKFNKIGIDTMKTKDMFKEMNVQFSPEQTILNDATPEGMTTDDLLTEIKDMYTASENNNGSSVDDAVAKMEADMEARLSQVKAQDAKLNFKDLADTQATPPETTKDLTPEKKSDTVGGMNTNNDLKLAPKQAEYTFKQNDTPEGNVTFYTKAKGDKTYKITRLNGVQTDLKINAPLIAPDKFEAFKRAIHDTAKANPDTAFQIRDFNGKVYYDSAKELATETPKANPVKVKSESTAQKLRKKFDEDYPVDPAAPETKEAMSEVFRNRSEEKMSFNELDPVQQYLVRSKLYPDYAAKEKENYREYIRSLIPKVSETTKESKISP